jgi:5'-deoxynucleotidase YfbR-like HD superfamily hydrolase
MAGRKAKPARAWQRMLSGRRLDLLDPSPLDVEISDIAHGLARVARWNGQTVGDHAFSVAQHSVLVFDVFTKLNPDASPQWQMAALLHDAAEYVIGDMISPFKATLGDEYKQVEKRLLHAIQLRFALPATLPAALTREIKRADLVCAYFEATRLAGFAENEAASFFGRPRGITAEGLDLAPLPAVKAQAAFLACFERVEQARHKKSAVA